MEQKEPKLWLEKEYVADVISNSEESKHAEFFLKRALKNSLGYTPEQAEQLVAVLRASGSEVIGESILSHSYSDEDIEKLVQTFLNRPCRHKKL